MPQNGAKQVINTEHDTLIALVHIVACNCTEQIKDPSALHSMLVAAFLWIPWLLCLLFNDLEFLKTGRKWNILLRIPQIYIL